MPYIFYGRGHRNTCFITPSPFLRESMDSRILEVEGAKALQYFFSSFFSISCVVDTGKSTRTQWYHYLPYGIMLGLYPKRILIFNLPSLPSY